MHIRVKIRKLHQDAVVPTYATDGSSGFDLYAIEDVKVPPGETVLVRTGLAFEIEKDYELQIRPRSGTSLKTPLRVANAPGTVDADYRGEVSVIIHSVEPKSWQRNVPGRVMYIKKGERIAQGVICPIIKANFEVVNALDETLRGAGGFGSTGN